MEEEAERNTFKQLLKRNLILILLVVGIFLGYIVATICIFYADEDYISRIILCVGFPGELLIHGLECMALPLAVSGVILSVTSMVLYDYSILLIYTVVFTIFLRIESTVLGVLFSSWIVPQDVNLDVEVSEKDLIKQQQNLTSIDKYLDIIRYFFPSNVITMTMMHYKTEVTPRDTNLLDPSNTTNLFDWDVVEYGQMEGGTNVFGVLCYSIFFAAALSTLIGRNDTLRRIFETLNYMSLMITRWVLYLAPLLSISLIAADVLVANFSHYLVADVGRLLAAILAAHAVQCLIVYPLVYFSLAWENPFKPICHYYKAILIAFITKSSWSAYPITILSLEEDEKVPSSLAKLIVPIAQAINKDGCAIFFTAATVFMYRTNDIQIDILVLFKICAFGLITSYAGSGVPYNNFACLLMMVEIVGIPTDYVPLFIAVDWIAGRTANVVNVIGDFYLVRLLTIYNSKMFKDTE